MQLAQHAESWGENSIHVNSIHAPTNVPLVRVVWPESPGAPKSPK